MAVNPRLDSPRSPFTNNVVPHQSKKSVTQGSADQRLPKCEEWELRIFANFEGTRKLVNQYNAANYSNDDSRRITATCATAHRDQPSSYHWPASTQRGTVSRRNQGHGRSIRGGLGASTGEISCQPKPLVAIGHSDANPDDSHGRSLSSSLRQLTTPCASSPSSHRKQRRQA